LTILSFLLKGSRVKRARQASCQSRQQFSTLTRFPSQIRFNVSLRTCASRLQESSF